MKNWGGKGKPHYFSNLLKYNYFSYFFSSRRTYFSLVLVLLKVFYEYELLNAYYLHVQLKNSLRNILIKLKQLEKIASYYLIDLL